VPGLRLQIVTREFPSEMGRSADAATSGFLYGESTPADWQATLDPKGP
jgi:hypothetical protein